FEQEEVRRRVDAAERPVQLERAGRGRPLRPLGEDDLEDIARPDVLLRGHDAPLEVGTARLPADLPASPAASPGQYRRGLVQERRERLGIAAEHLRDAAGV